MQERQYKLSEGNGGTLLHWRGDFYVFDKTHFKRLSKDSFKANVISWLQNNSALRKFSNTHPVANLILNIEGQVKIDDETNPSTWLDCRRIHQPGRINMKNGIMVSIHFWKRDPIIFGSIRQAIFSTVCLPYSYQPGATCPTWIAFIEKCNPAQRSGLQFFKEWFV